MTNSNRGCLRFCPFKAETDNEQQHSGRRYALLRARCRLPLQGVPSLRARCVPVILISNRALPNPYSFPKKCPLPFIRHPDIA